METPDAVVTYHPVVCSACQMPLVGEPVERVERRQVRDLPPVCLVVTEHRSERVRCPHCHTLTPAVFPVGVEAPAQYGPLVRALAVYLSQEQLVPFARVRAVLAEVIGCPLAVGTVLSQVQRCAAAALEETEACTMGRLQGAAVLHTDETPVRVNGQWQFVHVCSTDQLTHFGVHPQRGATVTATIGILPQCGGTAIHDGWTPYWHYRACRHARCNVHHLRELTGVAEHLQQPWAQALKELLLEMRAAVAAARAAGAEHLGAALRTRLVARYHELLCQGVVANPRPPPPAGPPKRGRRPRAICSTASSSTRTKCSPSWTTVQCLRQ